MGGLLACDEGKGNVRVGIQAGTVSSKNGLLVALPNLQERSISNARLPFDTFRQSTFFGLIFTQSDAFWRPDIILRLTASYLAK